MESEFSSHKMEDDRELLPSSTSDPSHPGLQPNFGNPINAGGNGVVLDGRPYEPVRMKWRYKELLSEALGTFTLVMFTCGSIAQVVLSDPDALLFKSMLSINICGGLSVAFGIYVSGGVSGGHVNPAVTLAMALHKRFLWKLVPGYFAAQFVGAFLGAALIYAEYYDAIDHHEGGPGIRSVSGPNATAGIFACYPQPWLSVGNGLLDQVIGTALLTLGIFAIDDDNNANAVPQSMKPLCIGLLVVAIGEAFCLNAGYAINPARDFGPRMFSAMVYGGEVFTHGNNYWWIPIVGPFIGGVLGAVIYIFLVQVHHHKKKKPAN